MRKLQTQKSSDILCLFSLIALVILIAVFILCLFFILPTVPSFLSNPDTVKLSQNYIFLIGTFLCFRIDAITRLYNHHQFFHDFILKKTLFLSDSLVLFVTLFFVQTITFCSESIPHHFYFSSIKSTYFY